MYWRTYFSKDNVIVKDSEYNFGNLEVVDLFYGGRRNEPYFSRYIFDFPLDDLKEKYQNCQLGDLSNTTHKLKFKHAGFETTDFACMPSSYRVCLFEIPQEWVEGCGVSTNCNELCTNFARLNCTVSKSPSNWYFSQSGTTWDEEGIFDSLYVTPNYIKCIDVDCQSSDLEIDVTQEINDLILQSGDTFYGYGLAFHYNLERETSNIENHVVFFGRQTNTYYEPFLETTYINPVLDDRAKFYLDKTNTLFLFTGVEGEPVNLDEAPIVDILNEKNELQFTLTGTCKDMGVYYVDFEIDSANMERCYAWTDRWKNLKINGKSLANHSMKFNILPSTSYYDLGYHTQIAELNYDIGFRGIKREEVLKRGDVRKIFIDIKSPSNPRKTIAVDKIFYKLYIKEGPYDELIIIDWMPANVGVCDNWFVLDSTWIIPNTYFLDIKILEKQTIKTYSEKIKFHIIDNEKIYF